MGTIVKTIGQSANIRATDANATLTVADAMHQVFTGLTVTRDCTLPTTGVLAGDVWRIENTTAFDLVIKGSNGTAITVANTATIDATIQTGFVLLQAVQATPTTHLHWRVLDLHERAAVTSVFDGGSGSGGSLNSKTLFFTRRMHTVHLSSSYMAITPGSSGASYYNSVAFAVRFRPRFDPSFFAGKYLAGVLDSDATAGRMPSHIQITSAGIINVRRHQNSGLAQVNWPLGGDTGVDYIHANYITE